MALTDMLSTEWVVRLTDKVSRPLVDMRRNADAADNSLNRLDKKVSTMGDSLRAKVGGGSGIGNTLLAGAAGFVGGLVTSGISSFASGALTEAADADKALSQIQAGLLSTKGVSGQTIDSLLADSKRFRENSLFGDDEIVMKLQAQLLTFTNITGKNFKRTEQAAVDLATRLGGDLQNSAIMLGKALNDPIQGLTALRRVGVSFTDDQQKMIATLVKQNDLFGAQKVILDTIEQQYGGSAAAASNTLAGALHRQSEAWKDLQESAGNFLYKSGILEGATDFLDRLGWLFSSRQDKIAGAQADNAQTFIDLFNQGIKPTDYPRTRGMGLHGSLSARNFPNAPKLSALEVDAYADYYKRRTQENARITSAYNLATDPLNGLLGMPGQAGKVPFLGALGNYVKPQVAQASLGKSLEDLQNELKSLQETYGIATSDAERRRLLPDIARVEREIKAITDPLSKLNDTINKELGGINSKVSTEKTPRIITVNINKLVEELTINGTSGNPTGTMRDVVAKALTDAVRDFEQGMSAN